MKPDHISLNYLGWFVFPVLVFFAFAVPLTLYFEPVSGDLTRIGHWPERDFGWTAEQPAAHIRANGSSLTNPRILVLGDSFSHPNIWQSYLADSRNLEILSFQYQDVGCVSNWLHWLVEQRSSNLNTVVIQTAERGLVPLFRNLHTCAKRVPKPLEITDKSIMPMRDNKSLMLDASYLIHTSSNTLHATWSDGRMISGDVVNVPLTTDRLFSNRKSNRLLYYAEDELKKSWSEKDRATSVANLKLIQDGLATKGLRLVLVVVPDKSSVYREYIADSASRTGYPDIFGQLKVAGVNNVNLLGLFRQAVENTVDLYLPNDTHLSTQGYKLMASKIADEAF